MTMLTPDFSSHLEMPANHDVPDSITELLREHA